MKTRANKKPRLNINNYRCGYFWVMALFSCGFLSSFSSAEPEPDDIMGFIDQRYTQTADLAQALWDYAELGYQEQKSSQLLQQALTTESFELDAGVAGMPTAFVASWGEGKPVIALLAEYDALPGISQQAVASRQIVEGKTSAHACGHNLFGAGSVSAAIALKHWLEKTGRSGTIRLYGTPAEEGGSGKAYLIRGGLFKDVDFALHWHPHDHNAVIGASTLANRSAKFRFRGVSAHAAAAPEQARSALDGVEAFNIMVNIMREHIPQAARIHYVITRGGEAPNVVPNFAEVYYYARHPEVKALKKLWQRIENAARGAALGTGVEVDWEIIHGNYPVLVNESLAQMMDEQLRALGGVHYNVTEKNFAEKIAQTLTNVRLALGSEVNIQSYAVKQVFGSTDVGDVSAAVPTVGVNIATFVPGTSLHSWQAVAAGGMSIGHKGTQLAAKVLTLSAIEIFTNENLQRAAREEFLQKRGAGFVYQPLMGNREPPLDYRKTNDK